MLVSKAQRGDTRAFSTLYTRYYTPLFRFVSLRVNDTETAEDLTSEIFLKIYRSLPTFAVSNVSPLAYWYTIARNTIIDCYRTNKTVPLTEDHADTLIDESPTPEEQAHRALDIRRLHTHVSQLSAEQQEVIRLRFGDELSYSDIARAVGKKEDAVRQIVSRTIKQLRTLYEKEDTTR